MGRLTTGIRALDDLIGGLRLGDNVVWDVAGVSVDPLVVHFLRASRQSPLVYISFHVSPQAVFERFKQEWDPKTFLLLDCFTDGLARGDPTFAAFYERRRRQRFRVRRVENASDVEAVQEALADTERDLGRGARYVFDSLTGMQELWGGEGGLSLFLTSCPRLYDLRTVAYWLLEREAHDRAFLSRLAHITQLLIELRAGDNGATIRVAKAEGRSAEVTGRRARIAFDDGKVRLLREEQGARERMGELLRSRRIARGVSQAEFARMLGISPSALSQAERGLTGLSGETLSRAWSSLGVPFGLPGEERPSYRVSRRGARETRSLVPGMVAEHVIEASGGRKLYMVRVDGNTSGRRAPFATKRDEVAVVLRGVFEVRIGEVRETLHAGDALVLSDEPVSWWRNPSAEEAELLWAVLD